VTDARAQRLIQLNVRDRFDEVVKLVGSEQALLKLLAIDAPELIESLVDAALERKLARLTQQIKDDPDRFWREHVPPYQPPLFESNGSGHERGRPKGSTNVTDAYFWQLYRSAVDEAPRLQRPYRKTHLAARTGLTYRAFCGYLDRWGPPTGYAKPGE
jgi:hypothetical protein